MGTARATQAVPLAPDPIQCRAQSNPTNYVAVDLGSEAVIGCGGTIFRLSAETV